jgi:PIF1-like helicase
MMSVSVQSVLFDDEMQNGDLIDELADDDSEPPQSVSFEDFAANLRNTQNTVDLYTLEALDASQDFGYFDATYYDCDAGVHVNSTSMPLEAAQVQSSIRWISVAVFGKAKAMFGKYSGRSTRSCDDDPKTQVKVIPSVSIRESTYDTTVDAIIRQYSLNCEQIRALTIVARHAKQENPDCPQLLMGLFGEGGTGKSRLIEAIRALFEFRSRSEELVVTATTGSAAYNIGGTTLHSATGIPVEYGDTPSTKGNVSQLKLAEWANRRYLIVDEVSMLDRPSMVKLETQLQKLTSDTTALLGGMNIIFCGDFLQLPTCNSQDLFIRDSSKFQRGNDLWRSLNAAVILKEQMRQADDPIWAALLQRVRLRQPTDDDIALLNTRVGAPLPSIHKPAIIVRRHNVRKATNNVKLVQESERTGVPITYCVAHIVKKQKMHLNEIYALSYKEKRFQADSILSLLPGVPLMLTKNVDIPLGTSAS